jgi:GWxTD domain-containing protein
MFTPAVLSAQTLQGSVDFGFFPRTDKSALVEMYLSVNGETLNFEKTSDGRKATVELIVVVRDTGDQMFFGERIMLSSPLLGDTVESIPNLFDQKQILLGYGSYKMQLQIRDIHSKDTGLVAQIPFEVKSPETNIHVSTIQLLNYYEATKEADAMVKNGYRLFNRGSSFYPKTTQTLIMYTELYGIDKIIGPEEPFGVFYKFLSQASGRTLAKAQGFSKHKANPIVPLLAEINISSVPSGNYWLVIEVRDKNNQVLKTARRFIQRSNFKEVVEQVQEENTEILPESVEGTFAEQIPDSIATHVLKAIRPISTQREIDMTAALLANGTPLQQKCYLLYYWRKRNADKPEDAYKEYISRLKTADQKFATRTFRSYETDRGRVFLQYGTPNRVETELTDFRRVASQNSSPIPMEIWSYYNIDAKVTHIAQTNRTFVFMEDNRGNANWRLVHSDAIGELNDPNWRQNNMPRTFMHVDDLPGRQSPE